MEKDPQGKLNKYITLKWECEMKIWNGEMRWKTWNEKYEMKIKETLFVRAIFKLIQIEISVLDCISMY